jgi:hypothetical protein
LDLFAPDGLGPATEEACAVDEAHAREVADFVERHMDVLGNLNPCFNKEPGVGYRSVESQAPQALPGVPQVAPQSNADFFAEQEKSLASFFAKLESDQEQTLKENKLIMDAQMDGFIKARQAEGAAEGAEAEAREFEKTYQEFGDSLGSLFDKASGVCDISTRPRGIKKRSHSP